MSEYPRRVEIHRHKGDIADLTALPNGTLEVRLPEHLSILVCWHTTPGQEGYRIQILGGKHND